MKEKYVREKLFIEKIIKDIINKTNGNEKEKNKYKELLKIYVDRLSILIKIINCLDMLGKNSDLLNDEIVDVIDIK